MQSSFHRGPPKDRSTFKENPNQNKATKTNSATRQATSLSNRLSLFIPDLGGWFDQRAFFRCLVFPVRRSLKSLSITESISNFSITWRVRFFFSRRWRGAGKALQPGNRSTFMSREPIDDQTMSWPAPVRIYERDTFDLRCVHRAPFR